MSVTIEANYSKKMDLSGYMLTLRAELRALRPFASPRGSRVHLHGANRLPSRSHLGRSGGQEKDDWLLRHRGRHHHLGSLEAPAKNLAGMFEHRIMQGVR